MHSVSEFTGSVFFDPDTLQYSGAAPACAVPAWGGQGWVALAGRLDDHQSLADALGLPPGESFSDSLLAARAIERWGNDAPRHLLGDFALAAWHGAEQQLILAGDAMCMRTIYYWRDRDRVVFSTSLRGLLTVPDVPRVVNELFVVDFLAQNFGDDDATFYRDIYKLEPGACVVLTAGGKSCQVFHRFDPERRIHFKRDQDYVDRARELLDHAVADRLREGPVAIMGSGGLDSACLAVATLPHVGTLPFLTMLPEPGQPCPPAPGYIDETPFVAALAAAFPALRAEFITPPTQSEWGPDNWRLLTAGAIPYRMPDQIAWLDAPARRAAALGATHYLTGAIGNHTLTWDGLRYLPMLFQQRRWPTLLRELLLTSRGQPRALAGLIKNQLYLALRQPRFDEATLLATCGLKTTTLHSFDVMERLRQRGNDPDFRLAVDGRAWRIAAIRRNRARRADGMNMLRAYQGIGNSAPLGDLRLVEFCLAIPEDQYLRDGETRWLARRLLRQAGVPARITENRQRGRQHPEWFAHMQRVRPSLPAQLDRLRRSATASRLLDLDRLERLINDWPKDAVAAQARRHQVQVLLQGAFSVGAFITWVEGTN